MSISVLDNDTNLKRCFGFLVMRDLTKWVFMLNKMQHQTVNLASIMNTWIAPLGFNKKVTLQSIHFFVPIRFGTIERLERTSLGKEI